MSEKQTQSQVLSDEPMYHRTTQFLPIISRCYLLFLFMWRLLLKMVQQQRKRGVLLSEIKKKPKEIPESQRIMSDWYE
uniref:Uncharacterized protein n=1 Tax=Octopus bimaculoides TaxID=37653 RepID=A0A0L8IE08_OCTBM